MRRISCSMLLLALAAAFATGCGSADEHSTPAACLSGGKPYFTALEKAPGAVRLDGDVPISGCLAQNQSAGDLATVGDTLVKVTTELNARARRDPGGPPTVQLGYLVGAVDRGASDTHGIHAELQRRIEAAALYGPAGKPPPPPFDQTYRKGYAAGRTDG
jgi:hypothetical protein